MAPPRLISPESGDRRMLDSVPRSHKKPRVLVADGRAYTWSLRHKHRQTLDRSPGCVHTLTLSSRPAGTSAPLRIVFVAGPGRFVPGGAPFGSGDVGFARGASLNLHEPGAVRALLDAAAARGWVPRAGETRAVEVDGWALLEVAAAARDGRGECPPGTS